MDNLRSKQCQPCDGRTPKLDPEAIAALAMQIPGWKTAGPTDAAGGVRRLDAIRFVNRMAGLRTITITRLRVHTSSRRDV